MCTTLPPPTYLLFPFTVVYYLRRQRIRRATEYDEYYRSSDAAFSTGRFDSQSATLLRPPA